MPNSTLTLKSSVTCRQAAEPVDQDERAMQLQHHQAAMATEAIDSIIAEVAITPELVQARDLEKSPKRDPHALQSAFLAANLNHSVTVFLINGIKLIGRLRQYDPFTVMLEGPDGINSLTFKHTISTIQPANRP